MKKLFLLLALLGMVATGCSKDEEGNIPDDAYISLNKEIVTISPDGGSVDVIVYSNYKWEISGTSDWCTPSVKGGNANEDGQKVTFSADVAYDDREAAFWFRCADKQIKFVVSQKSNNVIIYYTSSNGEIVQPDSSAFGATILSNTYIDGVGAIEFNARITSIGQGAFRWCSSLTSVTIPDSVTSIGNDAFYWCDSLTSVTIPDSVTSIGVSAFSHCSNLTSATIPNSVTTIGTEAFQYCSSLTSVTIPNSVTTIGERAFSDCSSLTSVTIPNSVTSIGDGIFYNCSSLTSVTIPDSVTSIGNDAFLGCIRLTSVTIPDSVTEIGDCAFGYCSSLQEFKGKFASNDGRCLIIDGTLNSFAPAGLTEYTIPDSVTSIGNSAFNSCYSLTSVTIGDSVTTIGNNAFSWCESLTSVYCKATTPPVGDSSMFEFNAEGRKIYVPMESVVAYKSASIWSDYADAIVGYDFENGVAGTPKPANNEIWYTNGSTTEATTPYTTNVFGANIVSNTYDAAKECWVIKFDSEVTSIGEDAFYWCESLTSVTIPDSVTTIGEFAFAWCSSLTSVTMPDSVTSIGYAAFAYCSNLESIYITDIAAWCNISFSYMESNPLYYARNLYLNNELVTDLTIPDSVTEIEDYAFGSYSSLTSVTIPDSVTSIGIYAFYGCHNLTSVTIPDSVTTIGNYAFGYCRSLTSVTFGDSVTEIGNGAFNNCSSLTSVTIPDSVTTIGNSAFASCSSLQEFNGKFTSEDGRCLIIDDTLNSFAPAGLTEYIISNSVTEIGYDAFYGCHNLTSVTIPDSVTTIGNYAFGACSSLTSVTIPDSVTTIEYAAFAYCSSLTSAYCKATTPPTALLYDGYWYVFYDNASNLKIYVPMESVEAYKSASGWSEYADAIEGYNF